MIVRTLICWLLTCQSLQAGLERYSRFVVADAARGQLGEGIRVTYLGTNGYQFETGGRALLVDPYFSRIAMSQILFPVRSARIKSESRLE
jgi:hypothetical protein